MIRRLRYLWTLWRHRRVRGRIVGWDAYAYQDRLTHVIIQTPDARWIRLGQRLTLTSKGWSRKTGNVARYSVSPAEERQRISGYGEPNGLVQIDIDFA